jgi:peroxiredoxin
VEEKSKKLMARKISINQTAPDITLNDINGNPVRLSNFKGEKIVLLVFNRGFM